METLTFSSLEEFQGWLNLENAKKSIIVKFTAKWCGPCQSIKEFFQDCSIKACHISKSLKIINLDVDENLSLYSNFKRRRLIPSIPTILLYRHGNKVATAPDEICLSTNKTEILKLFQMSV
jgi:thiol:disulfide interchange protein